MSVAHHRDLRQPRRMAQGNSRLDLNGSFPPYCGEAMGEPAP